MTEPAKRTLLNICDDIDYRIDQAQQMGDENIQQEVIEDLSCLGDELRCKVDSYYLAIGRFEDEAERLAKLAAMFSEKSRAAKNVAKRIDTAILYVMQSRGFDRMSGEAFRVDVRKTTSVETGRDATEQDAFQHPYLVSTTYSWDKKALKETLKQGTKFDFAKIVEKQHTAWGAATKNDKR